MVESKRIRSDRLKTCKNFLYELYENYSTPLNYYLPPDFKTSWMQDTKLNEKENNLLNDQVVQNNMLISINLNNIDINFLKDLIDNIKRVICVEPIQPLSLPPLGLMKLETSRMQLISTTEPNSSKVTQDNVLSKSFSIICAQLKTETNELHKSSSFNENKEMFIPALQPGKLIELENSKVICASLNIDSLRPAINLNKKNTDIKTFVASISVPRNPKITHESLLSSENNGSALNTPATLIPNKDNSNVKLSKTKTQEMSVYNGQISTSHTNIQLLKPQCSSKYNSDSIQFKNRPLFQNPKIKNHNDKKNCYSRFNNSTRMHDNPSQTEPLTRYCDPMPYKFNNISSSRKLKSVKTTQSSNSKLYIESKYRQQNKGWTKNKNKMNQAQDQYRRKIKKGNTNTGNMYSLSSTNKHQLKSKECYGHFKILKHIINDESKELKMVIVKLEKHTKTSENCNMDNSCNDIQTDDKLINVEKAQETKKEKLNSETLTRSMTDQSNVLICPFQNPKPFDDETKCNKSVEQNSNTSTVNVNKPKIKKARQTEVEKLHADINKMFGYEAVLNCSNIRQCRINKQIDYVNANDDQSNLFCNIRKLKNTKKNVKKSTIKLNRKEKFDKKSITNKTLPLVVKTAVLNKMYNKQPESIIDENLPESVICVNPSATAYDKTLPESNMLNFLPEQATNEESIKNQSPTKETKFSTDQPDIELSEYTLKEKSKKFVLAGLSCELISSVLLFKCSISNCLDNQFSSVYLIDFSKHINKKHQFVIWDGNCGVCHHKLQIVSGQYYVRNALEHLVSHHLVLKNNEHYPKTIGLKTGGSLCQEKKSQRVENSLRFLYLPGDRLSIHKPTSLGTTNIFDMDIQKSACVNSINKSGSQPSQTVVNTVPNSALMAEKSTSTSLVFDSKLVMINDVDQNHIRELLKTTRIRSESTNKKEQSNVTSNNDVALSEKEELNEDPKKRISLDIEESSIIELDKLFVCEECDKAFSNGGMYYDHLQLCPFWDNMAGRKCMYCAKVYKRKLYMTEHIKRHGPNRFKCSLCNLKVPTQQMIRLHMGACHRITNIHFVSEHPNLNDSDKDNFIALEDNTVMQKITQKQPNYTNNFVNSLITQQNTSLKRKHYSTIEKDELDKKIIEVILDNNMNTEIFPQFIQKNMLYKCSISLCTFTGMTEDILKKHISIFHPNCQYYICPHCPPQCIISRAVKQNQIEFHLMHHGSNLYRCQYCDYINFNRIEMRTHMRNTHLLELTSLEQSYIFVIRKTMLEDDSIDKGRSKSMLIL